jgi:hypothetical protein
MRKFKQVLLKLATALLGASFAISVLGGPSEDVDDAAASQPVVSQWALLELPHSVGPVTVRAEFHLLDIQKIDDEDETFAFSGVLTLTWQDDRQRFDPAVEGVQEMVYNGDYQFNELAPAWYPQAMLANASEVQDMQGVVVRVAPDGTGRLVQPINAVARSALDLRRYPFDHQRLEAIFEILGFDDSEVVIEDGGATVNRSRIQVRQWDLVDFATSTRKIAAPYAGETGSSSALVVSLDMERQPFFMVRLVILPLIVIMMLSWVVFWMDRTSLGDRMSVSFVGILTAVAYQTMVSSIMPQISYMTLIHGFLYFSFVLMCATVVVNLLVGNCDRRGDLARGDLIDRRCRWIFPLAYIVLVAIPGIVSFVWY